LQKIVPALEKVRSPAIPLLLVTSLVAVVATESRADEASAGARSRAFDLAYNLDRDAGLEVLREAIARWPEDPSVHRSLASLAWLEILFRRGSISVDDYIGALSRQKVNLPPPPPALAELFERHAQRAIDLARARLARAPRSGDALYEFGAAEGLLTSYKATVRGKVLEAIGDARRAYDAHERLLDIDAQRKDAALTVGIYRYVIGSLSLPLRLMAYVVGFGGDKLRGLRLIEEAATFRSDAQAEAQFALVLLYNREHRFDAALRHLEQLRERYPRNRLLWLETGATALRAGRPEVAEQFLEEGMKRLAADARPRAFGEDALWNHKRGIALARLGRQDAAERHLRAALEGETRDWVRGRSHLELGRLALARGDAEGARAAFERAASLSEKDNDTPRAREARRMMATIEK
jgi:tetratricopeptide (TPR) repeat protein